MVDPFARQQLLRNIFRALEKIDCEIRHYHPTSSEEESIDEESIDIEVVADSNMLEALLLKRITVFEKRFLPEGLHIHQEQLTLLKRAMLLIKYMQNTLEQQKSISGAIPQLSRLSSLTMGTIKQTQEVMFQHPLQPMPRDQTLPLSFSQQRLWFLEQLDPGTSLYNEHIAIRLNGALNIDILELCFNEVVRRHEILRTTFTNFEGKALQHITPWHTLKLAVTDLQDLPTEERETYARRMAEAEVRQSFDFIHGPLFKVRLFQLAEEDHLLLTTYHHIISDGWSMSVLYHELSTLYQAYLVGEVSPLAELPLQYADYTLWQHRWLQGEVLQEQFDYWQHQLKDAPTQLKLPTDRPDAAIQIYAGAQQALLLPPELLQQLKILSQHENATLFMTLLAAFQVLLMRYSNQQDFLVGSPIANRPRPELENLLGLFVNTLVLRADLSGNPSFQQLLWRVREMTLQAYAHQDLPFEKLVAELEPERNLSRQPLIQVAFALHNLPLSTFELPGISSSLLELTKTTSKFDLLMAFSEEAEGLLTTIEYNTDLFKAETIKRLFGHWQVLLEAIVRDITTPIENLPLLTKAEREHILSIGNATRQQTQPDRCLHRIFEQQVEQAPDSIALIFEHTALTYQGLNTRANQIASFLQEAGVGPDIFVAVALDRSLELVIALLAILKAGGAYVPLDPASPIERLTHILADIQPAFVLTQSHLQPILPTITCRILCLDNDQPSLIDYPISNLVSPVTSQNLAYMIYTSGSTGKPKGVMIPHANGARLFSMTQNWFHFQSTDTWTLFHSYAFDFSVWELWGPLLYGGRLVVVPYWISRSPDEFYRLLTNEQVTVLNQTPSAFWQLIQAEAQFTHQQGLALRMVIFGGEALELTHLRPWFDRHGDQQPQLVNMYGITETTVHVTYRLLTRKDLLHEQGSVIGGPIPDLQLYVLDARQQLVPHGIPGELYVGGPGLARGYWQRADISAERFVPHPFSDELGARLYRTGDLVRYLLSGDLEYLGRVDQQVKIRGFRIELGEIEAVLHSHAAIQKCVVVAHERSLHDTQLIAYVVPARSSKGSTSYQEEVFADYWKALDNNLHAFLETHLPDYMIPAHFVPLERLPLTVNGKIDRKALPAPEWQQLSSLRDNFVAPQTSIQQQLATIWAELLLQSQIGIHDNFFALGGHSLLATQVIARIRQTFQVEMPLRSLFEAPTIAGVSAQIEQALRDSHKRKAPPLLPVTRTSTLPLSSAQQRLWFLDQVEPDNIAYNAAYAMRLRGRLHLENLQKSLDEIIERHESLRTTFQIYADKPVQVIAKTGNGSLSLIDLSALTSEALEAILRILAQDEAQSPFSLARGPLLRITLLRLSECEHALLLTAHHIVSDGWSLDIFSRELSKLYEAFTSGKASPLTPLAFQYADFAHWQHRWLQGEVLDRQINYWTKQLRGATPLELPTDHPRVALPSNLGASHPFELSTRLSESLQTLSLQEDTTLFMTLLAAFQILLYRYTGKVDIVVGTDIANRTQIETEEIIGFFVNLLVLRSNLSGHPTFREALSRVRNIVLDAYAHQDLPFEKLVEVLNLQRTPHQVPLVRILFVLQNTPSTPLALHGLKLTPIQLDTNTTKFDLAVFLSESLQGLSGVVNYRNTLFDPHTIVDLVRHFDTLLHSVISQPDSPVDALEIYSETEQRQRANNEAVSHKARLDKLKMARRNVVTLAGPTSQDLL